MVKLDRRTAEYIIATGAAIDFLLEGKFANPVARAIKAAARRAIPAVGMAAGRAGISVAGTALGMGRLAMANPYVLGGTAIYVGYHERDRIKQLLEQGYDIIEERLPTPPPPPPLSWYTRRFRDHHRRNGTATRKRILRSTVASACKAAQKAISVQ